VLEVSAKWQKDHTGGLYGIYAAYADENNYVSVLFDVGRRVLRAQAICKGIQHEEIEHMLPETFNFSVFHLLRVEKTGRSIVIKLDDVAVIQADFPLANGSVGLHTRYTSASFAGFEVTRHVGLTAVNAGPFAELLERVGGNGLCKVNEGQLHCRSTQGESSQWKLDAFQAAEAGRGYRIESDIFVKRGGASGLLVSYFDEHNWIDIVLSRVSESITVTQCRNGLTEVVMTASLEAASFDWTSWHTMSATIAGQSLVIRVDQHMWSADVFDGLGGTPGLTGSGEAEYRETRYTIL
jgi:hypothetical protein